MNSPAFLDALQSRLVPKLPGVQVLLTEEQDLKAPALVLIRSRGNRVGVSGGVLHTRSWTRMGPREQDNVAIGGFVLTSGPDVLPAATAALDIVDALASLLRDDPITDANGDPLTALVGGVGWVPLLSDKGGYFVDCEYELSYTTYHT